MLLHLDSIKSDPLGFLIELLYTIPAVVCALVLHELGHGYVALRCGDPTAQMMGRLSFNPLAHLDPIGTASMFLLGIGWARPVPVNPRNFRNPRRDDILVSAAGITVNLLLFILGTALSVVCVRVMCPNDTLETISRVNGESASRLLMRASLFSGESIESYLKSLADYGMVNRIWLVYLLRFFGVCCTLNMGLAIFNLLPFPPLDGYRLANNILFKGRWQINAKTIKITRIVFFVLFIGPILVENIGIFRDGPLGTVLYYATHWLSYALYYAANGVQSALLWIFLPLFGMA